MPGPLTPLRGEIREVDLNPKRGREERGVRPCLVVSTDALNRSNIGTVIVCPITTADLQIADSTWQPKPHWVATDQIVTVDAEQRAIRHLATGTRTEKLGEIDESLGMLLNL